MKECETEGTHRLDREGHAGLHGAHGLVLGIVRHIGRGVEEVVDAMPAIRPHDGAPVLARNGLAEGMFNVKHEHATMG